MVAKVLATNSLDDHSAVIFLYLKAMKCIDYMIRKNVKRLPVVDKTGKVVGMLYERDIFFVIVKAMLNENIKEEK